MGKSLSLPINTFAVLNGQCIINAVASFNWEITQCNQTVPWEM